jgi:hypothetical protein
MKLATSFLALLTAARLSSAQSPTPDNSKPPSFQDNSFLAEEAYNQEAGVVQHITGLNIDHTNKAYELDVTQEWPVGGITHQLSYMLPMLRDDLSRPKTQLGDVMLNYRYQLIGNGDAKVAVSPRLSAVLPTGKWKNGSGTGAIGIEAVVPVSIVLSDLLVTHLDAGMRYTRSARNESGEKAGITKYIASGSVIVRAMPYFHFLVETMWTREDEVMSPGKVKATNNWTVLPGARTAFNYKSGLQIVPGIGFPFGIGPSRGNRSVFLYLSFEHPFNAEGRGAK